MTTELVSRLIAVILLSLPGGWASRAIIVHDYDYARRLSHDQLLVYISPGILESFTVNFVIVLVFGLAYMMLVELLAYGVRRGRVLLSR